VECPLHSFSGFTNVLSTTVDAGDDEDLDEAMGAVHDVEVHCRHACETIKLVVQSRGSVSSAEAHGVLGVDRLLKILWRKKGVPPLVQSPI